MLNNTNIENIVKSGDTARVLMLSLNPVGQNVLNNDPSFISNV